MGSGLVHRPCWSPKQAHNKESCLSFLDETPKLHPKPADERPSEKIYYKPAEG